MGDSIGDESMNDFPEFAPFHPTKKKKKKQQPKTKVVYRNHIEDSLHSSVDRVVSEQANDDYPALTKNIRPECTELAITPRDVKIDAAEGLHDRGVEDEDEDGVVQQSNHPSEGSEHDYHYRELLRRLLKLMHTNSPELAGDRQRTVLRPPQVFFDGIAQTVFVNFMDLCKTMHRPPEHVKAYMLKEIGSFCSLDGEGRLIVKGRFAPTRVDDLLQKYINEYVLCNCCRSPDTTLAQENQLLLLQCEMCGEKRPVLPVGAGCSARVSRRKRQTILQ